MYRVSLAADELYQVSSVFAADEMAICTARSKRIGQGQAAHDMACADLQRGVGAEDDFHQRIS